MDDERLPHRIRGLIGTELLTLATLASWWAWTAWDRTYDVDPATGRASGPWQVWQVAGVVLSLLAVVVVGTRYLPLWVVLPVVPLAFTAAWSLTAMAYDDTGLWGVGALMVLFGTSAGTALVAPIAAAAAPPRRRDPFSHPKPCPRT